MQLTVFCTFLLGFIAVAFANSNADHSISDGHEKHDPLRIPDCKSRSGSTDSKIIVGVCAMEKKSQNHLMQKLMSYVLKENNREIEVCAFPERVILYQPIESWPVVDALIGVYSKGFPVDKAQAYVDKHGPFVLNDLHNQVVLLDRNQVYNAMKSWGIRIPRHAVMWRDEEHKNGILEEHEDYIVVNGVRLDKPFVEKPMSMKDHHIYIYLAGGGSKRLFQRLSGNVNNVPSNESMVRRNGSYSYEEFIETDGFDYKVYTVGPNYAFVEARQAPTGNGTVKLDSEGKEYRKVVELTNEEVEFVKKIVGNFKQAMCGIDIIRSKTGESYVVDVNILTISPSNVYYELAAKELGHILKTGVHQKKRASHATSPRHKA